MSNKILSMMNRFYSPLVLTGLLMAIGSYYKDKRNYDYQEINEVRIKSLPDCIKYSGTDSLNLNPELIYTKNPDGDYSYEWIAVRLDAPLGFENKPVFIGKEKNLRYRIDLNTGIYSVCLSVRDETTGLIWKTWRRMRRRPSRRSCSRPSPPWPRTPYRPRSRPERHSSRRCSGPQAAPS